MKIATAIALLLAPALAAAQAKPVPLPAAPSPAAPARKLPGKPRLAVLDFTLAGSAHPDLARVLADGAARGAEAGDHQVITQGEVAALLGLERMRRIVGCAEDQGCLAEVAGALDADRLLSGSLTILERTALVTVRLIDTRKGGQTLARATTTLLDATEKELVDAARRLAHEAVTGKRLDTSGRLKVTVDRPGAAVTLDGKGIGESPLRETPRVLEGPHSVVVQKQGFVRWSSTVAVPAGAEVPVEIQLVPIQLMGEQARSRLWTWGFVSAGVAVAATAGGGVLGKMADDTYAKYKRETNRTRAVDLHDQTRSQATLANVSWGIAAAAALGAGGLLGYAMISDARAAEAASAAAVPLPGGAALAVSGRF
jgi:alkylated DNA nucleotide flippase Atl1